MQALILSVLLLCSFDLWARKPRVKRLTKKQRQEILQRKYNKENTEARSELHFLHNSIRECKSFAYHKKDLDLRVTKIYQTYPEELRIKFVQKNSKKICLKNMLRFYKIDGEKIGKDTLVNSIKSIGGRYWPAKYETELKSIAEFLAKDCREPDVQLFDGLLKTYFEQTRKSNGWCIQYHKEFDKNCPQFKLQNCK